MEDASGNGEIDPAPAEAEFTPSSTPNCQVSIVGIEDQEFATRLGQTIGFLAVQYGRYAPLHDLDGITVAVDYKAALQELDRGIDTDRVLTPSDGIAVGMAMAPAVLREGKVKTRIIIDARLVVGLLDECDEALRKDALYTVIHELSHCAQHSEMEANLPGFQMSPASKFLPTELDRTYYFIVDACWNEYYACRMSATFPTDRSPDMMGYSETFLENYLRKWRKPSGGTGFMVTQAPSSRRLATITAQL